MTASTPDIFDVVDEHDRVLHQETRAEVHRRRLLHRAVHVLVFNPLGQVYAQRRSATKDTFPLRWTTSCSGHVDAGEDYSTAVLRELGEELGLHLPPSALLPHPSPETTAISASTANRKPQTVNQIFPFLKHPPCRDTGWEFIWIYTLTTAAPLKPDPAEVAEGRWVSVADLTDWMTSEPRAFTPSFRLVWKLWREKSAL
jgi:isopentenyldiphosphate isomerase